MSNATRKRRRTAKKAAAPKAPKLTLLKQPKAPTDPTSGSLPTRPVHDEFMTDTQIRATYTAALAGVTHTRITGWHHQPNGTVRYPLPSGAALTYNPTADTPLTAWTPCRAGTRHPHPVTDRGSLLNAQLTAATCTSTHDDSSPVRALADALARSENGNEDTQATDTTELRAALDNPKEHPHG